MNALTKHDEASAVLVRRHNREALVQAYFDASQGLRRLAHRAKQFALEAEAENNHANYAYYRTESDRLWKQAKWHLEHARISR